MEKYTEQEILLLENLKIHLKERIFQDKYLEIIGEVTIQK